MKSLILGLAAAAIASVALPAAADPWYAGGDYGRYQSRYFTDYPQFRGAIAHIRGEIREGQNEGWLSWDEVRQANWRLQRIQRDEQLEFREHGWRLPDSDADEIRDDLNQLDRWIDRQRDEGDNDDNRWQRRY